MTMLVTHLDAAHLAADGTCPCIDDCCRDGVGGDRCPARRPEAGHVLPPHQHEHWAYRADGSRVCQCACDECMPWPPRNLDPAEACTCPYGCECGQHERPLA